MTFGRAATLESIEGENLLSLGTVFQRPADGNCFIASIRKVFPRGPLALWNNLSQSTIGSS
jgi:hypothetical protein